MTTNTPAIFNFNNHEIRTIVKDGDTWFIASDICKALEIANHRDAIGKLDDDEKGVGLTDTLGGKQDVVVVNESGMYLLILRCRDAVNQGTVPHKFRKWVTSEVLPAIRKTGKYEIGTVTVQQYGELATRIAERFPVGKDRPYAWSRFNNHFRIASYKDLPAKNFEEALIYIDAMPVKQSSEPALVDIAHILTMGLSEPTVPLSAELQRAVNQKSFAVAHEFFETFQQHLAKRIAFTCEHSYPVRVVDEAKALRLVEATTIDSALTHHYFGLLSNVAGMAKSLGMMTDAYQRDIQEALGKDQKQLMAA